MRIASWRILCRRQSGAGCLSRTLSGRKAVLSLSIPASGLSARQNRSASRSTTLQLIELTKRDVQGKPTDVVRIDHLESGEVVSSLVLCPLSTLQVLYNFLKETTKGMDMKGTELDSVDQQVAMLIYSGMDSHAIENMLNIPHKQLDAIYDKIMKLGLAEVVTIRREVQLTTKGVRYISDATKSQTN